MRVALGANLLGQEPNNGYCEDVTEQQRYDVVKNDGTYEIRRYHTCVVAEFTTVSEFDNAGSAAFRPLFNYITGSNHTAGKIAMTSPVIQEAALQIPLTEPRYETMGTTTYTVSFVMPGEYRRVEELPTPNDSAVKLRVIPEQLVIVDKFSGRWSESLYNERLAKLTSAARLLDYQVVGPARFARFNPPITPWFLRRNEIQIPVRK